MYNECMLFTVGKLFQRDGNNLIVTTRCFLIKRNFFNGTRKRRGRGAHYLFCTGVSHNNRYSFSRWHSAASAPLFVVVSSSPSSSSDVRSAGFSFTSVLLQSWCRVDRSSNAFRGTALFINLHGRYVVGASGNEVEWGAAGFLPTTFTEPHQCTSSSRSHVIILARRCARAPRSPPLHSRICVAQLHAI